jgi:hypothetical protein
MDQALLIADCPGMAQGHDARFALLGDAKYPNQITGGAKHHHHFIEFAHQLVSHNVADEDGHADAHKEDRIDDAMNDDVPAESQREPR